MSILYRVVYSNLNKSGPWIYQNGKIMFHMTFPYGKACHYSICSQISQTGKLPGKKSRDRFILRKLCEQKAIEIIEANACPDHIHMLISVPPKYKCITDYGISQRKKQFDGFRQICKSEIQKWKQA